MILTLSRIDKKMKCFFVYSEKKANHVKSVSSTCFTKYLEQMVADGQFLYQQKMNKYMYISNSFLINQMQGSSLFISLKTYTMLHEVQNCMLTFPMC